uniref:snRNA-activating protein complex subunit 1 n=1 Tax=Lygus hesperus TaxID=30085 RepID=A0A0K8STT3_LYGHE
MALIRNPIMDGVQEDLSSLGYSFIRSGSTDFTHFVHLWNSHNFCYIYSGRVIMKEVKHFTREILIMAKQLCSPKNSFVERVAGVYIMYALYFIQPLKLPIRIRIEKDEFQQLLDFVNECNLKEVRYCFYKLFSSHAFDFVYSDKLYSLERMRERELEKRQRKAVITKEKLDLKEQLEFIWKTIDFDQNKWLEAESNYNRIKSSLNKLGESANFEMTEFLKPLLTIEEKLDSTGDRRRMHARTSGPGDKKDKKKRIKSAVNLLFEDPSSSEEDALGGTESMPHLGFQQSEEEEDNDCS